MERTWIEIDEQAIISNIKTLRSLSQGTCFCAIVKANAYGHGMKEVAQIAARVGVQSFGVDTLEDAFILREILPSAQIIVLGYVMQHDYPEAVRNAIELTISDREDIEQLERVSSATASTAQIHAKIETGTSRRGILMEELVDFLLEIKRSHHVSVNGISTHFANVEDTGNSEYASVQFSRFSEAINEFQNYGFNPPYIHCACSAAILLYPATHGTLVRAGIGLYGLWPSESVEQTMHKQNISCELRPVLKWKTRIAQVKSYSIGTPIGYGSTEKLKQRSRIAVLPVGYWDGYDRSLSSIGEVLVGGYRCKVVGRVCMNMMMIDVSSVPTVEKEQVVTLLGIDGRHEISASEIARKIQTIPYEIVTRINPQLPRIVLS
ncbi:alanine racemase [Candidatus Uhrbacteria bacterium]|nr:alanine racemase [Candidatus Uhrbacteria bacterium]